MQLNSNVTLQRSTRDASVAVSLFFYPTFNSFIFHHLCVSINIQKALQNNTIHLCCLYNIFQVFILHIYVEHMRLICASSHPHIQHSFHSYLFILSIRSRSLSYSFIYLFSVNWNSKCIPKKINEQRGYRFLKIVFFLRKLLFLHTTISIQFRLIK